jgi:glycosyltransferase involved in cell wall biosynthesis
VKELHRRGKKIICHYHGEDLRNRGVMPFINKISSLNLTNEVDLLERHPRINYLFLPYNTKLFKIKESNKKIIRVAHAPTNRLYKGSNFIIQACKKLEKEGLIKFDLIENNSHKVALEKKNKADIFIDQVGDRGGWGYGMNSVESLSMGICTLTEINDKYNTFIPDHPFVNINKNTLFNKLKELVLDRNKIYKYGINGKKWVEKHHDIENVSKKLYSYYNTIGF